VKAPTVVIPSRSIDNLVPCVAAVRQHDPDCRIVVVWDQSDGNRSMPVSDDYTLLCANDPFIYARNCNRGIAAAGDGDVVLLNDDALLKTPFGFSYLSLVADENRSVGILGAVTNVTGQPLQQPHGIGLRLVPFFAFVCALIPRRTLDTVGLLDERYCVDYGVEDRDYCEMVTQAGLQCAVYDGCFVDHASLRSTFRGDPRASRSYAQNLQLYCQKWGVTA